MPSFWQRHPLYSVLVVVAILTTVYLLVPYDGAGPGPRGRVPTRSADLESRVRQSTDIYDKALEDRKGLIQKFGPTPSDIALYVAEFHNCFDNVS